MKLLQKNILLMLSCMCAKIYAVAPANFSFDRSLRSSSVLSNFNNPTYISSQTTITESGTYGIVRDIFFDPDNDNENCITISAHNVVLDLNLKSITHMPGNTRTGINAIYVTNSCRNIIIRNGHISNFSGSGIVVQDGSEILDIFDVTMDHCGFANVLLDGLETGTGISTVIVTNVSGQCTTSSNGSDVYGLYATHSRFIDMENSVFAQNQTTTGDAYGVKLSNCQVIRLRSCIIGQEKTGGLKSVAVELDNCETCLFFDTVGSENVTSSLNPAAVAIGFNILNSTKVFFETSSAYGNEAAFGAQGIRFNNCTSCSVNTSQALSNQVAVGEVVGFLSEDSTGIIFEQCSSRGNVGGTRSAGFVLRGTESNSAIKDCEALSDLATTGTAFGIYLDGAVDSSIIKNTLTDHRGPMGGFGFFDSLATSTFEPNTVLSNVALNNITNYFPSDPAITLYSGGLNGTPGPFENVSL